MYINVKIEEHYIETNWSLGECFLTQGPGEVAGGGGDAGAAGTRLALVDQGPMDTAPTGGAHNKPCEVYMCADLSRYLPRIPFPHEDFTKISYNLSQTLLISFNLVKV